MQSNTNTKKDLNKISDQVGLKESTKEIYQPVKKLIQEKTKIHDSNPEAEQFLSDEKQVPLKVYWESKLQKMLQKPKQFESDQAQYQIKKNSTIQQQQSEPIQQEKQTQSNDIQITQPDDEVKEQLSEKKLYLPKIPSKFKARDEVLKLPKIFYQVKQQQQQKELNEEEKKIVLEVQDQVSLKISDQEPEREAEPQLVQSSQTIELNNDLIKKCCWDLFEEKEAVSKAQNKTEKTIDQCSKDSLECFEEKLNSMDACLRMDWLILKIKELYELEKNKMSKVCEKKEQKQSEVSWCQNTLLDENIEKIDKKPIVEMSSNLNLFEQMQIKSQSDQKEKECSQLTVYPELVMLWNEQIMPQIRQRSDASKIQKSVVQTMKASDKKDVNKSSETQVTMNQQVPQKQVMSDKNEFQDPMVTPELKKREEQIEIPELFDSVMGAQVIQKPNMSQKSNETNINYQIDLSQVKQKSDSQKTNTNTKSNVNPKIMINDMEEKIQNETNATEIIIQSQKDQDNYNLQKLFESTLLLPKTNKVIEEKQETVEESTDPINQSQTKKNLEETQNESFCMDKLFASIMQTQVQYQKLDSESQSKMQNEMSQLKQNKLEIIKEIMQDTQFEEEIQQQFMCGQSNGDSQKQKNQYQEISQQDNDQLSASVWESLSKSWVNIKNRIVGDKQI